MPWCSGSQGGGNRPIVGENEIFGATNLSYLIIGQRKEIEIDANFVLNAFSFICRSKIILV